MPVRATKRGAERTPLDGDCDVLICGASFAGLAVARELARQRRARAVIDRYEIGERQTSACAAPTAWLRAPRPRGRRSSRRSASSSSTRPRRHARAGRCRGRSPRSTTARSARCCAQSEGDARVRDREGRRAARGYTVHTDRGDLRAPLIVDALGWRRVLGAGDNVQPPEALPVARPRGPPARQRRRPRAVARPEVRPRAATAWSFPAGDEVRVGVGSFDPRDHVKEPTLQLADDVGVPAERYQGNWIPHQLRPAVEDGVFFAGDSAGHCLPTTAEGIRTALYFGLALRPRAARRRRGPPDARAGAGALRRVLRRRTLAVPLAAARAEPRRADHPDAAARPGDPRDQPAQGFVRWAFGNYLRHLPAGVRRRRRPGHRLWRAPRDAVAA